MAALPKNLTSEMEYENQPRDPSGDLKQDSLFSG
jgi:hypothetical protein